MPGRSNDSASARLVRRREPATPDLPDELTAASLPVDAVADDGSHVALAVDDLDQSGVQAARVEIDQCRYRNTNLSRATLRRALIRDSVFERCDLANLRSIDSSLTRVIVSGCRMTGSSWLTSTLRDVSLTDCRADLTSFASSKFSDVAFVGCRLEQADFADADLSGATFDHCDLTRAQFAGAKLTGTRFAACDLADIQGVTSLRGAIITSRDAMALAFTLARALGITIEDE